jgi:hypothetical protein
MGLKNLVDHSARRPLGAGQVAAEVANILETSGAFNGNIKKERFPRALTYVAYLIFFLKHSLSEKWVRKILGSMEISTSYCADII